MQGNRHSHLVGFTGEYEKALIDLCPFDDKDEYALSGSNAGSFRRISQNTTFLLHADNTTANHAEIYADLDRIERTVGGFGRQLIDLYFCVVHPSFPILHKKVFLEKYSRTHREFSPPLLAAVYILALHWWNYDRELSLHKKPDVATLEVLAAKTLADVMHRPKLSAVQAGLLLLQRTTDEGQKGSNWILTSQLVAVGQELGLHLDCSDWKIPRWEKGLRRRLAWGLFMQDKWGALTHGRPSHISKSNWIVRPVLKDDFPEDDETSPESSADIEKGRLLFEQMITLTSIMSDVLDTFFSVEAQSLAFSSRSSSSSQLTTQKVLEKAKPIQIRLKEWFVKLPECLRMEALLPVTNIDPTPPHQRKLSSTGYLHLAYFATEITLHRQILRTLAATPSPDPYLSHIVRSAAKTRLISAMDFVNRLKPEHLNSFWYFASSVNFGLIGTFGSLLWATSPTYQEAEFYKARLEEYRWTLAVSAKAMSSITPVPTDPTQPPKGWLHHAIRVLETNSGPTQQSVAAALGRWKRDESEPPNFDDLRFGLGMGVGIRSLPQTSFTASLCSRPPPAPPLPPMRSFNLYQAQHAAQHQAATGFSGGAHHHHSHQHPPSPMSVGGDEGGFYDDDGGGFEESPVGTHVKWRLERGESVGSLGSTPGSSVFLGSVGGGSSGVGGGGGEGNGDGFGEEMDEEMMDGMEDEGEFDEEGEGEMIGDGDGESMGMGMVEGDGEGMGMEDDGHDFLMMPHIHGRGGGVSD